MGNTSTKIENDKQTDIDSFLNHVTRDERKHLFSLIQAGNRDEAIKTLCQFMNYKRNGPRILGMVFDIPQRECRAYGVYLYSLLEAAFEAGRESNSPDTLWGR